MKTLYFTTYQNNNVWGVIIEMSKMFEKNKKITNELNKQLEQYLNYATYNYAFMINGQWGSGKSYFIDNKCVKMFDDKEFIKVSLNGLKENREIDIKLVETLIQDHLGRGKLKKIGLKKVLSADLLKQFNYKNIIAFLDKEYRKLFIDVAFELIKKALNENAIVLVFDDLERCEIPIDNLLAYINDLVEIKKLKVIVIANEEMYADLERFKEIKEKVIGISVEYIPNIEENIKEFSESIKDKKVKDVIVKNRKIIKDEMCKRNCANMRTLQFIIDRFSNLYNIVLKDEECENELLNKILKYIVYASIIYKEGKKIYDWGDAQYGEIDVGDGDKIEDMDFIYGFKFVDLYIKSGSLDKKTIIKVLNDYKRNNLPKSDPYNKLSNRYWELKEDEVIKQIDKIYENLLERKYPIKSINKIISLLLGLKKFGYKVDIDKFISIFKELIRENVTCEEVFYWNSAYETFIVEENIRSEYLEIVGRLKEYYLNLRFKNIEIQVENGDFENLYDNHRDSEVGDVIKSNFFSNINLEKLTESIEKCDSNNQIWALKYFCDAYKYKVNNEREIKAIKELINKINKIKLSELQISKKNAVNLIISRLENIVDTNERLQKNNGSIKNKEHQ